MVLLVSRIEIRDEVATQFLNRILERQLLALQPLQFELVAVGKIVQFPDASIERAVFLLQQQDTRRRG